MSNPMLIKWPQDRHGILSPVKVAGLKAVERLHGNPDKYEAFMNTLRVLAEHAKVRFEGQAARRAALIASAIPAEQEEAAPEEEKSDASE